MRFLSHYLIAISLMSAMSFLACDHERNFSAAEKLHYTKLGNSVVKQTFDTLSHSLKKAIGEMGIEKAVSYCQVNAYLLTDTYASDSVTIRRTALKYRNPVNRPDPDEERILNAFATQKEQGVTNDSLKATAEKGENGTIHFYKPILLQPMCASCHGSKIDAGQPALWATIDSLYPSDLAYGFKPGDLRGMWHVIFTKKSN